MLHSRCDCSEEFIAKDYVNIKVVIDLSEKD